MQIAAQFLLLHSRLYKSKDLQTYMGFRFKAYNTAHVRRKNKILPNKLLETHDGGTILDTGTTSATSAENKAMATVE
jgi:hypothetical protein